MTIQQLIQGDSEIELNIWTSYDWADYNLICCLRRIRFSLVLSHFISRDNGGSLGQGIKNLVSEFKVRGVDPIQNSSALMVFQTHWEYGSANTSPYIFMNIVDYCYVTHILWARAVELLHTQYGQPFKWDITSPLILDNYKYFISDPLIVCPGK
jgi:hypothetical protein